MQRETDLLARLPEAARDLLENLIQRREDARALLLVASEAARESREELRVAMQHLAYAKDRPNAMRDEATERGYRRTIEASRTELAKKQAIVAEREAALQPLATLVAGLVEQLGGVGAAYAFVPYGDPVAKGRRGETPSNAVERIRVELAGLAADRARIESAPRPRDVLKAEARKAVEALAARGRPDVAGIISGRPGASLWPTLSPLHLGLVSKDIPFVPSSAVDAGALLAWLAPDQIIERLEQELDRELGDSPGISDEERAASLAALDSQRLSLERDEEAMIRAAEASGQVIQRRPNANALAVLGVALAPALPSGVDNTPKMTGVAFVARDVPIGMHLA